MSYGVKQAADVYVLGVTCYWSIDYRACRGDWVGNQQNFTTSHFIKIFVFILLKQQWQIRFHSFCRERGIIRSFQFFGNSVYGPLVFVESHLNDMPFFACQVLTFSVFCGIIAFVHSDDSFRIGVWLLNSTTESSLWILFFTIAASFYNLQRIYF